MKDSFFVYVKIFLMIIIFYFVLYKTIFSCLLKHESGFHNVYAILLTAVIMTCFELGFIWINYYYGFNNSASNITNNFADEMVDKIKKKEKDQDIKDSNISKKTVDAAANLLSGFATVDNSKVNIINEFATSTGLLLIVILVLLLVIVKCFGNINKFELNPRVIYSSIATAILLAILFGFFYFSTTSVYKMIPNDMDVIKSIKTVIEDDVKPPGDIEIKGIFSPEMKSAGKMLVILGLVVVIGNKYIFPKIKNYCN